MDRKRFLDIANSLYNDDRYAIDYNLTDIFNKFLERGVKDKFITFEEQTKFNKGITAKRNDLYNRPVIGPDGKPVERNITREDGTKVKGVMRMVDLLKHRASPEGGLMNGYQLPEGSYTTAEGVVSTKDLSAASLADPSETLGKRDILKTQGRSQYQQEELNKQLRGHESMTAGKYAAIGAGGVLGTARGVFAPVETGIRKALGQSNEDIIQDQYGGGAQDLADPFGYGQGQTQFIGQKFTQAIAPTLAGLTGGAALGAIGASGGAPGSFAGMVIGAGAASTATSAAQNNLVDLIMGKGFSQGVAGAQKQVSTNNLIGEIVAEALPNFIGGAPKIPSFLDPGAVKTGVKALYAGVKAGQAATSVQRAAGTTPSLLELGYHAGLAKLPKLAAANQAVATSKLGRSVKGFNQALAELSSVPGSRAGELGEEVSEFTTDVAQAIAERNALIADNEERKKQGKELNEIPSYLSILGNSILGASFEGENRLGTKAFAAGGRAGQGVLNLADAASRGLTGQSLNPFVQSLSRGARTVNPITGTATPASTAPATPGATAVSGAEAADMFRGFTTSDGSQVVPLGNGQFGVVNASGRVSRVVSASEIDPSVFTPRGSATTDGTTEAHVDNAGVVLSRKGLNGAEFRPVGENKETVLGTTNDGFAVRRTVDGDKIDVRVVSLDMLAPENQTRARQHLEASGIKPTDTTGYVAQHSYAEEAALNRMLMGTDTAAATNYDAAFDTEIAMDQNFSIMGRVVGKAKHRGREVNTHYVVQVPGSNGQVDTIVVPAQNLMPKNGKLNIHPPMSAGMGHDVLKYSDLQADVHHDVAKSDSGRISHGDLADGTSPVMLTPDQHASAQSQRDAVQANAEAMRAAGKTPQQINQSTGQRNGALRRNVQRDIEGGSPTYNRGDYIEHTDYQGNTVAGVVINNTPNGPLIAPLDNKPPYVAQPSTISYVQSDATSPASGTPTPSEAARASIEGDIASGSGLFGGADSDAETSTATPAETDAERTNRLINTWNALPESDRLTTLIKVTEYIVDKLNESGDNTFKKGDWDSQEIADATGLDVDIVDTVELLFDNKKNINIGADGKYDYSKLPNLLTAYKADASKSAGGGGGGEEEEATPEGESAGTDLTPLPLTLEETAAELGPQEGRGRKSEGEEAARAPRSTEEQEEYFPGMTLADVKLTESEESAVAEFKAHIGGAFHEIQAVKPRNIEELYDALTKFLTGSKKRDGSKMSVEEARKAAKLIAELYDRMIFAQANRVLQMTQDRLAGKTDTPSARTTNRGKRINTEHGPSDVELLDSLSGDFEADTREFTGGTRGWADLTTSRADKDIAARVMRKVRMKVMQKYYTDNVPLIGVLDSVDSLNDSFNAVFAKGLNADGSPSLQVLIGMADRNVSSAVHEIAHALLENMPRAMQEEALRSLGFTLRTPTPGNPSIIPLEAHEKWATTFEAQILNAGAGAYRRISSDRTTEQAGQLEDINAILEGLSPYLQEVYNVAFDNTGTARPRSLVWQLDYPGNEDKLFLWDNMPLVIAHNGEQVLAKIPLADMPQRMMKYTGPGLLPKGSTKTFTVVITQKGHPDEGKEFTITNGSILAIGGASNGFNTRLATTFAYWLSSINARGDRNYKGLGSYENYGRQQPAFKSVSATDQAVLASMGMQTDASGQPLPVHPITTATWNINDPKIKEILTNLGMDDLTQRDLNDIKNLGLAEDADYWARRYNGEQGDWKGRIADAIIDLRGVALAKKFLQGKGAVAANYLKLTNGRYHPKFVELAEAIADTIRTSRLNILAAEKTNDAGELVNVNNFELINFDSASGLAVIRGPKSNPKTYQIDLKTGFVYISQGVVTSGPDAGTVNWVRTATPPLPAGFKKWVTIDNKAEVGTKGATAVQRMMELSKAMGGTEINLTPVNYYYQIARILVSKQTGNVIVHAPNVFFQMSGSRALNEAGAMPLAQANQKKRNRAVGIPLSRTNLVDINIDTVEAIKNQKHNEHVMKRVDTSSLYNVRASDLPNSHAERSAMLINAEIARIMADKDDILKSLRQAAYASGVKRDQLKPYVYRVFDNTSYIDPETQAPALEYETTDTGEPVLDDDGNRIPVIDEVTGEPVLAKKYVERYVVSYQRINPKDVTDLTKEQLITADGTPIAQQMTKTERAYKVGGRIVFYDPIDVQADGSSSPEAVDKAINFMVSEFQTLAMRAMEKYTPIVHWDSPTSGMQVWSPTAPIMKVEAKQVAGVKVLMPSLGSPKQPYNIDAVGATNRWNATTVTELKGKNTTDDLIDAVDANNKHYYMVTKENGEFKYHIAVTNVETKAISVVDSDKTYATEKEAKDAAQTEYEHLRGQAYLVWHEIGASRIADDILRIAELSQKSEKGLTKEQLAEVHNAKVIMRQYDWYRGVSREIMKRYGKAGLLMADLIGATSPQTPVDANWVNAGQILQNMMRPVYERIVRDTGGAKTAYRLPFSSERSITVYSLWRTLSYQSNQMRDALGVRTDKEKTWDSPFVSKGKPNIDAIENATDKQLKEFLGDIAGKLETKVPDEYQRRQLESVVKSYIESVYWKRDDGGSDPVASFTGWSDRTQDWIPVSGVKYEQVGKELVKTNIENEFMPLQRTVVPRNAISGAKFGANTDNVMQALYNSWLDIDEGVATKARNFSLNLVSLSSGATIDVWAARYIRRAFHDWHQTTPGFDKLSDAEKSFFARIPPIAESGVEGGYAAKTFKEISFKDGQVVVEPPKYTIPNPADPRASGEFGAGQAVMQMATDMINKATGGKLDMLPSDLQAVLWFTEKEVWSNAGWTNSSGAGGSFEFQMMQDIIRFGGFDRWTAQLSGNGVAHLTPVQKEVTLQLLNRMVYKGYTGDTIPVGYSSFLLSNTSGDQLSIDGRSQLDGMVIGYKGNTPLEPYNPETDLHLVVLNTSEKMLQAVAKRENGATITVSDPAIGVYVGKRIALGIQTPDGVAVHASVVPERVIENTNGSYTVELRTPNPLTDSTEVVLSKPILLANKHLDLKPSESGEYSTAMMPQGVKSKDGKLPQSQINGTGATALFPARKSTGRHRALVPVAPFDPYRIYESVSRYIQMSGSLDGVISRNVGDLNDDRDFNPMSNVRAGFEWTFAPALANQRIVGDPQQVRYYQQFSYLINRLQSHFADAGQHLQLVVQNDPRNVSTAISDIQGWVGIHGVWTPEVEMRYADFGVDALGPLSSLQKANLGRLQDYLSNNVDRIRQHEQQWLETLGDFMARPDIQDIVKNEVKMIQSHMSLYDVTVIQREGVHNAGIGDIASLFQQDVARQSISEKLRNAIETLGIIQEGDRVIGGPNTQAGTFNEQTVREVTEDIKRANPISLGLYQRKRKRPVDQGNTFHIHATSYAGRRIAGLDTLFSAGLEAFQNNQPERSQKIWRRITEIAVDEIDRVFGEIGGARTTSNQGLGIFWGDIEPSVDTTVVIPATASVDEVLARAAHIGLTFHQSNVFITQWGMSKNEKVGEVPANGDYAVERGVIIKLDKPMTFEDVKKMQEDGIPGATLSEDGMTLTSFSVEVKNDDGSRTPPEVRVKEWEDEIGTILEFLKGRGIKAKAEFQNVRFWNLGAAENGTWGIHREYGAVLGDVEARNPEALAKAINVRDDNQWSRRVRGHLEDVIRVVRNKSDFKLPTSVSFRQATLMKSVSTAIADNYEAMTDNATIGPNADIVAVRAYDALKVALRNQHKWLTTRLELVEDQPYANRDESSQDILLRNRLKIQASNESTLSPFHPLFDYMWDGKSLDDEGNPKYLTDASGTPVRYYDMMRAMYTAIGDGLYAKSVGEYGSDIAYAAYGLFFEDPYAFWAATTEIRGRDVATNFGSAVRNIDGSLKQGDDFAESVVPAVHKAGLLPMNAMVTGIEEMDNQIEQLAKQVRQEYPDYDGSVPVNRRKFIEKKFFAVTRDFEPGMLPLAQRKRILISDSKGVPAGNIAILDADGTISNDIIADVIANEPNLDGTSKYQGPIYRLVSALAGNVQHIQTTFDANYRPYDVALDIITKTERRFPAMDSRIGDQGSIDFFATLRQTISDFKTEFNWLVPVGHTPFQSPVEKTADGKLIVYHATLSGKKISMNAELLSGDDVGFITGQEAEGLGGTSSRISYTYNKVYAEDVAKMLANMQVMANMTAPFSKMSDALNDRIESAVLDNEPGLLNDRIRKQFESTVYDHTDMTLDEAKEYVESNGIDSLMRHIDNWDANNLGDGNLEVDQINSALQVLHVTDFLKLGELHDGLMAYNKLFGTPYAMITTEALRNVMQKGATPTKDVNVVIYQYALDPAMLTEHVLSEYELRTYTTVGIEPTGKVFDRTMTEIASIPEGDIVNQGMRFGHLLAQKARPNYRSQSVTQLPHQYTEELLNLNWEPVKTEHSEISKVKSKNVFTNIALNLEDVNVNNTEIAQTSFVRDHNLPDDYFDDVENPHYVVHTTMGDISKGTIDNSMSDWGDLGTDIGALKQRLGRDRIFRVVWDDDLVVYQEFSKNGTDEYDLTQHHFAMSKDEFARNLDLLNKLLPNNPEIAEFLDKFILHGFDTTPSGSTQWQDIKPYSLFPLDRLRIALALQSGHTNQNDWMSSGNLAMYYVGAKQLASSLKTFIANELVPATQGKVIQVAQAVDDYVRPDILSTPNETLMLEFPIDGVPIHPDAQPEDETGRKPEIREIIFHEHSNTIDEIDADGNLNPQTDTVGWGITIKHKHKWDDYVAVVTKEQYHYLFTAVEKLQPQQVFSDRALITNVDMFDGAPVTDTMTYRARITDADMVKIMDQYETYAINTGVLEIPTTDPKYFGTTDIVANAGFDIVDHEMRPYNHVLHGLIEAIVNGDGQTQRRVKLRFAQSLINQLFVDYGYGHSQRDIIRTMDWGDAVQLRLEAMAKQLGYPHRAEHIGKTWAQEIFPEVKMYLNSNAGSPRKLESVINGANSGPDDVDNIPTRGPNGGILVWHGTLYGQEIGSQGALLSANDLSLNGVDVSGGGGSAQYISTTWSKRYAFDVARSNFNLTVMNEVDNRAEWFIRGIYDLAKRIQNSRLNADVEPDPRGAYFLKRLKAQLNLNKKAYESMYPDTVNMDADEKISQILESSSETEFATRWLVACTGAQTYKKRAASTDFGWTTDPISLFIPPSAIVNGKPLKPIAIKAYAPLIRIGKELREGQQYALRNANGNSKVYESELQDVCRIAYHKLLAVMEPSYLTKLNVHKDPDFIWKKAPTVAIDLSNAMLDLATIVENHLAIPGGRPDLDAGFNYGLRKVMEKIAPMYDSLQGMKASVVESSITDNITEAYEAHFPLGLGPEDKASRSGGTFNGWQNTMYHSYGTPYFLVVGSGTWEMPARNSYDTTPVVYEYEVRPDFQAQDWNNNEWEMRTTCMRGLVPTGRVYDAFGNDIGPFLKDQSIKDVVQYPNQFLAQSNRRALKRMNPKGWKQSGQKTREKVAKNIRTQFDITAETGKPKVISKPLASRRRSGRVPVPSTPPTPPTTPTPPAPTLRRRLFGALLTGAEFLNDIGRMPLTGDMSPLTIQNWLLANPIEDPKLFFAQFKIGLDAARPNLGFSWKGKTISSDKMMGRQAFHDLGNDLRAHPMYKWANIAGLRLTTIEVDRALAELRTTNPSATLMDINELDIQTDMSVANKALQHGLFVGQSNRFFSMSKDYVKFTKFANAAQHMVDIGYVPGTPAFEKAIKDFAGVFNVLSGDIRFSTEEEVDEHKSRMYKLLFFAPRWGASRLMVDPVGRALLRLHPKGVDLLKQNRINDIQKLDPGARWAYLRMLAKTWALWAALQGIYNYIYRGFGYGASESTKGGMRLRVGETIISPPGGIDKAAALAFAIYDSWMNKSYTSPEERLNAGLQALKSQLLGNVSPVFSMGWETLSGRDLMGAPSREVYTPLQTYYNSVVRPKMNAVGVDAPMPKISNMVASRVLTLAAQDYLESFESLQERERTNAGERATAYGVANVLGLRARYAPKATTWKYKADQRAPAPGIEHTFIGKERDMHGLTK